MKKIVIIGSPGAGKSTFAHALGHILDIEVFHLDRYFWQPGWKEYARETRIEIEQQLIKGKDRWIIEGTYLGSSDSRLQAADTIIFLDMPPLLCLKQAVKRYITYKGDARPDIPAGCKERLSPFYILKILAFPHRGRNLFLAKIKELHILDEKNILTCRSGKVLADFLQMVSSHQQKEHTYEQYRYPQKPVSEEAKEHVLTTV